MWDKSASRKVYECRKRIGRRCSVCILEACHIIGIAIYISIIYLNRDIFKFLPVFESNNCLIESGDSLRKLSELVRNLRKLNIR